MNKLVEYFRSQMTPSLGLSIAFLVALLSFLSIDHLSKLNSALESQIADRRLQVAQMEALTNSPIEANVNTRLYEILDALNARLLTDETEGLNSANFQQQIRETLQGCGLQNVSVQIETSEDPAFPGLLVYEGSARARDSTSKLALCIKQLSEMDVAGNVSYMSWKKSGTFQINVLGFSKL